MDSFTHENSALRKKVESLETSNQSLLSQLHKLQSIVNKVSKPIKASATQTGTCMMVSHEPIKVFFHFTTILMMMIIIILCDQILSIMSRLQLSLFQICLVTNDKFHGLLVQNKSNIGDQI